MEVEAEAGSVEVVEKVVGGKEVVGDLVVEAEVD